MDEMLIKFINVNAEDILEAKCNSYLESLFAKNGLTRCISNLQNGNSR